MSRLIEVHIPKYPECWESCGNCGSGEVIVEEILVQPGDLVEKETPLLILETGKVALDIPSPETGKVSEIFVAVGERVYEKQRILTLLCD